MSLLGGGIFGIRLARWPLGAKKDAHLLATGLVFRSVTEIHGRAA